jgi:hypothetical protein
MRTQNSGKVGMNLSALLVYAFYHGSDQHLTSGMSSVRGVLVQRFPFIAWHFCPDTEKFNFIFLSYL